jgi:hypothetical protein
MLTKIGKFALIVALIVIAGVAPAATAQKSKPAKIPFEELLRLLANQPDHLADRTLAFNNSVVKMKFAKKQNKVRTEFYPLDQPGNFRTPAGRQYKIITIIKPDQPMMALDPQAKTYADAPPDFSIGSFDVESFIKAASGELNKINALNVGTVMVGGKAATKMKVSFEGKREFMYFYFAKDGNLLLKIDSGNIKQMRGSYSISNLTFNVPDELFEVPPGYKKVDFNSIMETLKIKSES